MSRHCNSVQNKAETVQYGTAQYISKQCSTDRVVWHSAYSVVQSSGLESRRVQCSLVQCSGVQRSVVV